MGGAIVGGDVGTVTTDTVATATDIATTATICAAHCYGVSGTVPAALSVGGAVFLKA